MLLNPYRFGVAAPTIAYVSSTKGDSGVASTMGLNVPAGVANGDLLVVCLFGSNDVYSLSAPAGWTLALNDAPNQNRVCVFTRVASSEPASYTFTSSAGQYFSGVMGCFRPSAGLTPSIQCGSVSRSTSEPSDAAGFTATLGGIVTAFSGNEINVNSSATATGMTAAQVLSGGYRNCAYFVESFTPAGVTGNRTVTWAHSSTWAPRVLVKICAS